MKKLKDNFCISLLFLFLFQHCSSKTDKQLYQNVFYLSLIETYIKNEEKRSQGFQSCSANNSYFINELNDGNGSYPICANEKKSGIIYDFDTKVKIESDTISLGRRIVCCSPDLSLRNTDEVWYCSDPIKASWRKSNTNSHPPRTTLPIVFTHPHINSGKFQSTGSTSPFTNFTIGDYLYCYTLVFSKAYYQVLRVE
jgi:hypothetical protein